MFGRELQKILEKTTKNDSQFLIIGEDHRHSSALIGLAHHAEVIEAEHKKVIIVTENLKRLTGFFSNDEKYSDKNIQKTVPDHDKDKAALLRLMQAKVEVHGLESKKTAPGLFLKGKTKPALLDEAKKIMPFIFTHKAYQSIANEITSEVNSEYCDVQDFKDLINRKYAATNERITEVNTEIAQQLLDLHTKNSDALIVFTGGAAHLPEVKQHGKVIDEGVISRLENVVGQDHVYGCFITSLNNDKAHKPRDEQLDIGVIQHVFKEPSEFPSQERDFSHQQSQQTADIFLKLNQNDKSKAIENIHANKKLSLSASAEDEDNSNKRASAILADNVPTKQEDNVKLPEETTVKNSFRH